MSQSANSFHNINIEKSNKSSMLNDKKVRFENEALTIEKNSASYENSDIQTNSKLKNESLFYIFNYVNRKNSSFIRMSNFWKNHEEDSIINDLPPSFNLDNNNILHLMRQKEVEKKFQEFFSFNPNGKIILPQNNVNQPKKEPEKNETSKRSQSSIDKPLSKNSQPIQS